MDTSFAELVTRTISAGPHGETRLWHLYVACAEGDKMDDNLGESVYRLTIERNLDLQALIRSLSRMSFHTHYLSHRSNLGHLIPRTFHSHAANHAFEVLMAFFHPFALIIVIEK